MQKKKKYWYTVACFPFSMNPHETIPLATEVVSIGDEQCVWHYYKGVAFVGESNGSQGTSLGLRWATC
jgi:hypothetical protein